jgi:hypothetical protein
VKELPGDLPAALAVVLHVPATGRSLLAGILSRAGPLAARSPAERTSRASPTDSGPSGTTTARSRDRPRSCAMSRCLSSSSASSTAPAWTSRSRRGRT